MVGRPPPAFLANPSPVTVDQTLASRLHIRRDHQSRTIFNRSGCRVQEVLFALTWPHWTVGVEFGVGIPGSTPIEAPKIPRFVAELPIQRAWAAPLTPTAEVVCQQGPSLALEMSFFASWAILVGQVRVPESMLTQPSSQGSIIGEICRTDSLSCFRPLGLKTALPPSPWVVSPGPWIGFIAVLARAPLFPNGQPSGVPWRGRHVTQERAGSGKAGSAKGSPPTGGERRRCDQLGEGAP
jgi:hypothetical protein